MATDDPVDVGEPASTKSLDPSDNSDVETTVEAEPTDQGGE
jgi:hypothetical protein